MPFDIAIYVLGVAGAAGGAAVEGIRYLLSSSATTKDTGPRKIVCKIPSPGVEPSCFTEKQ